MRNNNNIILFKGFALYYSFLKTNNNKKKIDNK